MGPRTEQFEREFADRVGAKHAVAVSSCTSALHLAYLTAGVGPGDEVIVPAITFVATAAAVRYCGATAVPAEIRGQHDLGIDPDHVDELIDERTRAVCAVHFAGYPAEMDSLRAICERRGVALVEDAAHAPTVGPTSLSASYSFFSNKVLSCGEGGLLASNDDEVAARARSLRSHAMTSGTWERHRGHASSYDVVGLGFNYRMDEPRAALLSARLHGLEADVAERRRLVRRYRELLRGEDALTIPYDDDDVDRSSCYVMPVMVAVPELREPLREYLLAHEVQTSVLYPAFHELSEYAAGAGSLPRSELAARTELTLPLYPHLSRADQDQVVAALRAGIRELG